MMAQEIELKSLAKATKEFAASLLDRMRELDAMEQRHELHRLQVDEILDGMIQNFVWAVVNVLKRQDEVIDLAEQDRLATAMLANPHPYKDRYTNVTLPPQQQSKEVE